MFREEGKGKMILELSGGKIRMTNHDGKFIKSWDAADGDWNAVFNNVCNTFKKHGMFYSSHRPREDFKKEPWEIKLANTIEETA
jgi:hypothetical protein